MANPPASSSSKYGSGPVDGAAGSGGVFVALPNRTVFTVYRTDLFPGPCARLAVTEDVVECFAVSEVFDLLAFATRDGRLHFVALGARARSVHFLVQAAHATVHVVPAGLRDAALVARLGGCRGRIRYQQLANALHPLVVGLFAQPRLEVQRLGLRPERGELPLEQQDLARVGALGQGGNPRRYALNINDKTLNYPVQLRVLAGRPARAPQRRRQTDGGTLDVLELAAHALELACGLE